MVSAILQAQGTTVAKLTRQAASKSLQEFEKLNVSGTEIAKFGNGHGNGDGLFLATESTESTEGNAGRICGRTTTPKKPPRRY